MAYFGAVVVTDEQGTQRAEATCDLQRTESGPNSVATFHGYLEQIQPSQGLAGLTEASLMFPNGESVPVSLKSREIKVGEKTIVTASFTVTGPVPELYQR